MEQDARYDARLRAMKQKFAEIDYDWDQFAADVRAVRAFGLTYAYATYSPYWTALGSEPDEAQRMADLAADYYPLRESA